MSVLNRRPQRRTEETNGADHDPSSILDVDGAVPHRNGVTFRSVAVLVSDVGDVGDRAVRVGELEAARLDLVASRVLGPGVGDARVFHEDAVRCFHPVKNNAEVGDQRDDDWGQPPTDK